MPRTNPYDYETAGFDQFLDRSIDRGNYPQNNLDTQDYQSTEMNYDQSQQSGRPGNIIRVGNIEINGEQGRITVFDENGNEAVWIGNIDG